MTVAVTGCVATWPEGWVATSAARSSSGKNVEKHPSPTQGDSNTEIAAAGVPNEARIGVQPPGKYASATQ